MIFLMTGTYPLCFDRLLEKIDELCGNGLIPEKVMAQIGHTDFIPQHYQYKNFFDKEEFDQTMAESSALIGHAGMGIISSALEYGKPLLVVPRMKEHGEIVNNHQVETARIFERQGHILVAYDVDELAEKVKELSSFRPMPRENQAAMVADRLLRFIDGI